MDGDICISNALDYLLKFKGQKRKFNNKNVENNLQLHAYKVSGSDKWIILIMLPCDKNVLLIMEMGKAFFL